MGDVGGVGDVSDVGCVGGVGGVGMEEFSGELEKQKLYLECSYYFFECDYFAAWWLLRDVGMWVNVVVNVGMRVNVEVNPGSWRGWRGWRGGRGRVKVGNGGEKVGEAG